MGKILIVEDSEDVREVICRSLDGTYEVRAAKDGIEALAALAEATPDVALIDVLLPGTLSGLGIAARARAQGAVVLMMTGGDTALEDLDGFPCIRKPFGFAALVEQIEALRKTGRISNVA